MARYVIFNTVDQGLELSTILASLSYPSYFVPPANELPRVFEVRQWNENGLGIIPDNFYLSIFTKDNFGEVIVAIGELLGDAAFTKGEGTAMVAYMQTGQVLLEKIIPSQLPTITNEEFEAYFKPSDINGTIN